MIFQGRYSHASDVWSFGVLAWELFAAFSSGENLPERTFSYHDLLDHVVKRLTLFFYIPLDNKRSLKTSLAITQ